MRKARLALLFVLLLTACERIEETPSEFPGPEYFPLQKGAFIIYKVDSTRIIQNVETNFLFELRVSVVDSFVNGEGNTTYILQREKRTNSSSPWKLAGTWSAWKSVSKAVLTEGNESFVKLQFPLAEGKSWDGNALNSLKGFDRCDGNDCDEYVITALEPELTVTLGSDTDILVRQDVRVEKYVRNVGLVYKESTVLEYCTAGACFGKQFVDSGVKYKQEMISSGTL